MLLVILLKAFISSDPGKYLRTKNSNLKTRMKKFRPILTVLLVAVGLTSLITACKKDDAAPVAQVAMDLPASLSMTMGEQQAVGLPEKVQEDGNVTFELSFTENADVKISNNENLSDRLKQAVTIDATTKKLNIDSKLLYSNDSTSSITGSKLPSVYKVTVIGHTSNSSVEGRHTLELKIVPAKLTIEGADNSLEVPFAYTLYSESGASFNLQAPSTAPHGTSWYLHSGASNAGLVSLVDNQIRFAATAGDPKKQAEVSYDIYPALQKDGFTIASRHFKVMFIPNIKFIYGTYYSDLDITVITNRVFIGLSNAYRSSAPTVYPEKYKKSFSIVSIEKDSKPFTDSEGIFGVESATGVVTVKKNTTLKAGSYKVTVKAITTVGLEFLTDFTIGMESMEE